MKKSKVYSGLDGLPNGKTQGTVQKGCLVLEGGAFRGLYNQGVLDAFLEQDINIHTVIGVSAGALAGMNYVAGQLGRSARANLKYRHDSRYIGAKAWLLGKSIVNVDFLLKICDEIDPLDKERLTSPDRHFVAVATNCLNGNTEYYDANNCSNILTAIKASATMPYISPMIDVDGTPCLDGGCSCAIPYQWALDEGFDKIIIIKTRERGYRKLVGDRHVAERYYRKYPAFAKALDQGDARYNKECDAVDELEKKGQAFVIAPSQPVTVGRLESDMEKLGELYWLGYEDAMERMSELRRYLEG